MTAQPEPLPVIFRRETAGSIIAFFPTLPEDVNGRYLTCYAHLGQHSGASFDYYRGTKRATPNERQDLLRELRGIYERDGDCRLVIYERMTPQHRAAFNAAVAAYRKES
jgi:hypothetical protein